MEKKKNEAKENYQALGSISLMVGYTKNLIRHLQTKIDAKVHMVMRYTPPFCADIVHFMDIIIPTPQY